MLHGGEELLSLASCPTGGDTGCTRAALQYTAVHCTIEQCSEGVNCAVQCRLQMVCSAVQCSAVQCSAVCSAVQTADGV